MRKSVKILLTIFCFISFINIAHADTLKQVRDKLAEDKANQAAIVQRQKNVQSNLNKAKSTIGTLESNIEQYEDDVEEATEEIDNLNDKIATKQKEIDNLVSYLYVSEGDNIYLEYVFNASSFTDMIYRSTVVEKITEYNDDLVDQMYKLIDEQKNLQEELQKKIEKAENSIDTLGDKLEEYDVTLEDLAKAHTDIAADIKARENTLAYYEKIYKQNSCKETMELVDCLSVPNSKGFVKPLTKGTISSEYGYRICPVHGRELHSGIDIAVAMGTNVYAAAAGKVSKITVKSSCGGNIVYINHIVNGKEIRTYYMHLATVKVKVGQEVTINTVIGTSGGGGYTLRKNGGWDTCSTGAHLHFGFYKSWTSSTTLNPRTYISFPAKGKSFSTRW